MFDWKKTGERLLFPPVWLTLIFTVISAVALVWVFLRELTTHPIAYIIYVFSFYTLTIVCIFCSKVLPKAYKSVKSKVYGNKFCNRYMTDVAFKTHVSLYRSLGVNLLYVGINALSGILYHSAWFGILAGYYIILAVMRFLLLRYVGKNPIGANILGEWKRSRVCAAILTLINLVLSGTILMIMYRDRGFVYPGVLIYVMAMYTFYITTSAIINIIKYRKYKSPVMSTTKMITLAAALVSMLSLETAMLTAFGAETAEEVKRILIAATGAGISIVVVAMSSYMIVRSTREIWSYVEAQEDFPEAM